MFGLLKLAVYALLGYAIYEFFRGFSGEGSQSSTRSRGYGGQESGRRRNASGQFITGGGEGRSVSTETGGGGNASQVVGRGVMGH